MSADSSLTACVAQSIVTTKARRIPADVMHLGQRSMLDGIGLALAGSAWNSAWPFCSDGRPLNPLTDHELADNFRECAAWGELSKPKAEKIVDVVFNLESVKSIRELTWLLEIGAIASKTRTRASSRRTRRTQIKAK